MAAVTKSKPRVRVSKNRKKNWNKYCDIKEVEEFLEEKRFEERVGGAASEKKNEELYFIQVHSENADEGLSKSSNKTLKCFQNIGAFSKVPPPLKQNFERYSKRIKNGLLKTEERRAKYVTKNSQITKKNPDKNILRGDFFEAEIKDLWGDEKDQVDPEMKELIEFRDEYTKKRTPKVPRHRYQKPSLLPAVEVPHAGASYNPTFDDHQNLLRDALVIEEKKQKEELHVKRVLTDMFPTRAEAPTQESMLEEMAQGLFEKPDAESAEDKKTIISRNPPVNFEDRVPKSLKRRKKERKEQARLKSLEKIQKKRLNEVYRLRSLKSEILNEERVTDERIARNQERKVEKMYQPRTLSAHKYEAPDLEVNLTEELCGSLRLLKAEGNLLEDRYKSLQRRNLIEPRILQKRKRKYKLKVQVKRSHRNFE